jgi:uncharacterized protein YfiM (DUF2279 family)
MGGFEEYDKKQAGNGLKWKMLAWPLGSDGSESGGGEPSLDQRQA